MEPTDELVDALYREEVLSARRIPPGQKLLDGPSLFDYACRIMEGGIRDQFPDADDERVQQILRSRLALGRRLEDGQ